MLEEFDGFRDALGPLRPVKAPLQIEIVGLQVFLFLGEHGRSLLGQQFHFQLFHDRQRDLVLNVEYIGHLPVEAFGPKLEAIRDVHQLSRDPQPVAYILDAAFQNRVDVESAPDQIGRAHV